MLKHCNASVPYIHREGTQGRDAAAAHVDVVCPRAGFVIGPINNANQQTVSSRHKHNIQ